GLVAVATGYLGICALVEAHEFGTQYGRGLSKDHLGYGYGAYLGGLTAALLLLAAGAANWREIVRLWRGLQLLTAGLTAGLCVAFLLPWGRSEAGKGLPPAVPWSAVSVSSPLLALGLGLPRTARWWHARPAPPP